MSQCYYIIITFSDSLQKQKMKIVYVSIVDVQKISPTIVIVHICRRHKLSYSVLHGMVTYTYKYYNAYINVYTYVYLS